MKLVTTDNGTEISIYGSAKELPITRYTELQKYLAMESGIGSNIEAINMHYLRLKALIEEDKKTDAIMENENALLALRTLLNGVSYYGLAFGCLVARIGAEMCEDISEEGLFSTIEKLKVSGLTQGALEDAVEEVKKKSLVN